MERALALTIRSWVFHDVRRAAAGTAASTNLRRVLLIVAVASRCQSRWRRRRRRRWGWGRGRLQRIIFGRAQVESEPRLMRAAMEPVHYSHIYCTARGGGGWSGEPVLRCAALRCAALRCAALRCAALRSLTRCTADVPLVVSELRRRGGIFGWKQAGGRHSTCTTAAKYSSKYTRHVYASSCVQQRLS